MNVPSNPSGVRTIFATLGFLVIAGFFLQTEHRAHLFGVLPFLFVLACPLLHLLHGGHRGHDEHTNQPGSRSRVDHSTHVSSAGGFQ